MKNILRMAFLQSRYFRRKKHLPLSATSRTPIPSESLYDITADCLFELKSPNGKLTAIVDKQGRLSMAGRKFLWRGPVVEPPGYFSWSPASNVFFIDDGEGSGLSSNMRMFLISGEKVREVESFRRGSISYFRRGMRCDSSSLDPNSWGFGWSKDGKKAYLFVQPTTHSTCGDSGDVFTFVVEAASGKVLKVLSMAQARKTFPDSLPKNVFHQK